MNKIPFDLIRKYYESVTPYIIQRSIEKGWVKPYTKEIDFAKLMTPIEYEMWQCIRSCGKLPMYPQYPVGKYFADFGNPHLKIAIECDGKDFHKDKEKDKSRDIEFKKLGWKVYRVTGRQCKRIVDINIADIDMEYMKDEKFKLLEQFYNTTGEGLVYALALINYNPDPADYLSFENDEDEIYHDEYLLAKKCLEKWESNTNEPPDSKNELPF